VRVVELAPAGVAAEILGVGLAEEGALVMIEPPREARVIGVFEILEIDDGVFVASVAARIRRRAGNWRGSGGGGAGVPGASGG